MKLLRFPILFFLLVVKFSLFGNTGNTLLQSLKGKASALKRTLFGQNYTSIVTSKRKKLSKKLNILIGAQNYENAQIILTGRRPSFVFPKWIPGPFAHWFRRNPIQGLALATVFGFGIGTAVGRKSKSNTTVIEVKAP